MNRKELPPPTTQPHIKIIKEVPALSPIEKRLVHSAVNENIDQGVDPKETHQRGQYTEERILFLKLNLPPSYNFQEVLETIYPKSLEDSGNTTAKEKPTIPWLAAKPFSTEDEQEIKKLLPRLVLDDPVYEETLDLPDFPLYAVSTLLTSETYEKAHEKMVKTIRKYIHEAIGNRGEIVLTEILEGNSRFVKGALIQQDIRHALFGQPTEDGGFYYRHPTVFLRWVNQCHDRKALKEVMGVMGIESKENEKIRGLLLHTFAMPAQEGIHTHIRNSQDDSRIRPSSQTIMMAIGESNLPDISSMEKTIQETLQKKYLPSQSCCSIEVAPLPEASGNFYYKIPTRSIEDTFSMLQQSVSLMDSLKEKGLLHPLTGMPLRTGTMLEFENLNDTERKVLLHSFAALTCALWLSISPVDRLEHFLQAQRNSLIGHDDHGNGRYVIYNKLPFVTDMLSFDVARLETLFTAHVAETYKQNGIEDARQTMKEIIDAIGENLISLNRSPVNIESLQDVYSLLGVKYDDKCHETMVGLVSDHRRKIGNNSDRIQRFSRALKRAKKESAEEKIRKIETLLHDLENSKVYIDDYFLLGKEGRNRLAGKIIEILKDAITATVGKKRGGVDFSSL
ncbi:MAG TPA: hypothetical protein VJH96_02035 [Patescibacteria group bacterium]|nr:hypothetical protein [Patescibacteria group bacterium]